MLSDYLKRFQSCLLLPFLHNWFLLLSSLHLLAQRTSHFWHGAQLLSLLMLCPLKFWHDDDDHDAPVEREIIQDQPFGACNSTSPQRSCRQDWGLLFPAGGSIQNFALPFTCEGSKLLSIQLQEVIENVSENYTHWWPHLCRERKTNEKPCDRGHCSTTPGQQVHAQWRLSGIQFSSVQKLYSDKQSIHKSTTTIKSMLLQNINKTTTANHPLINNQKPPLKPF